MGENISVELGNAAPNSLSDIFRSVICHVLLYLRGRILCTEHSDVKHKAESVSHLAATTGEVEQVLL